MTTLTLHCYYSYRKQLRTTALTTPLRLSGRFKLNPMKNKMLYASEAHAVRVHLFYEPLLTLSYRTASFCFVWFTRYFGAFVSCFVFVFLPSKRRNQTSGKRKRKTTTATPFDTGLAGGSQNTFAKSLRLSQNNGVNFAPVVR